MKATANLPSLLSSSSPPHCRLMALLCCSTYRPLLDKAFFPKLLHIEFCILFFIVPKAVISHICWLYSSVAENGGDEPSRQHSHQDRKSKPVCASFHQPSRSDWDQEQGLFCFVFVFLFLLLLAWSKITGNVLFWSSDPTAESWGHEDGRAPVSSPRQRFNWRQSSGKLQTVFSPLGSSFGCPVWNQIWFCPSVSSQST